jgi:UDP-N-acetylglucosamine--N-acetylmuramyl-(pentapeptide) pyrophosphoryl-undecaprenol N-acetylglucosamine transferase
MKTIILCGGKTLGHVTPGISVIKELHKKYPTLRIIYITSDNQKDLKVVNNAPIDKIIYFNLTFNKKIDKTLKAIKYYKELQKIIKLYKPICVISFGSFIGTLAVLASNKQNIKTVIHEQNACFGLGNKIASKKVNLILSNFKIKNKSNKFKVVGNPIFIENENSSVLKNPKKLVITSGTNGSKAFSKLGVELYNNEIIEEFDVTFITGVKYFDEVKKQIKEKVNFKIVPFIDNLSSYLLDTSFIISRAGALTLSEIYYLDIYPIIIPSTNVSNNHQYKNALKYTGECTIITEDKLDVNKISHVLKKCQNEKILNLKSNSTLMFIKELENVVKLY